MRSLVTEWIIAVNELPVVSSAAHTKLGSLTYHDSTPERAQDISGLDCAILKRAMLGVTVVGLSLHLSIEPETIPPRQSA
ncbi:hypothetical protein COMA2_20393 [Candidatus Nitrospira nitrificans]|uniref:Uncharacterized protein n=1 Tax=Candidatus Nitrospira nitrificans TaxID=1742973 RepID=A0A0S4LIB7_9BACT|nr:hypothetical protein COMA2_20393 [Candidatus Nitrospira nitrificans]